MADQSLLSAAVLGIVEGLTEFIPVSSTGHLLLLGHFIGFESAGKTFEVVIQLGAVLAVLSVYSAKLWQVFSTARTDPKAFRFIIAVALAFLPAVVVGVLAHDFIKRVLFETPMLVAINLIWGGAVLLWVDRMKLEPRYEDAMDVPLGVALKIGLFQCLAMIPGVSRSGSTIVGGLLMGVGKRGAAEFSFFLSMPTMGAAFAYDLWKSRHMLDSSAMTEIAVGFVLALISAILVVKWLLGYVSRHGYALFGWWRIIVGAVALTALSLGF
ncbi:MAG: undecaprenyl-diphosphatase [Rhodobacterales bacterium 65-51]|jgi:undecaprenyl-diphosphatase|uniref:undecaprenyl-diphosphate phosphatase n=1 Tax=uncultured Gemmobacter sp. TaxID=1095917 RepID=UPI000962AE48|nr:undecaprenyl-diphosphate phosphatase [uncultured Gemmobacter sp.]OJY36271.1 MAG: undecaprenyl-diphosphatase [Rhodobacterales bacterium 65-51]